MYEVWHFDICEKHLQNDRIISLKGKAWANNTITPSFLLLKCLPIHESGCIYVLGVSILPRSEIILLDFGTVPTVWYFYI